MTPEPPAPPPVLGGTPDTLEERAKVAAEACRAAWNDSTSIDIASHIAPVLVAFARDLVARNARVLAKIQRCSEHGASPNAWGCPECVREARHRIPALTRELAAAREELDALTRDYADDGEEMAREIAAWREAGARAIGDTKFTRRRGLEAIRTLLSRPSPTTKETKP